MAAWGYFLYQGVVDPLGGINTLWPLFGIANQMLAGIALILAHLRAVQDEARRYAWVTMVPTAWLLVCTLTAGWQKMFHANVRIGFVAHARKFQAAIDQGRCWRRPRPWTRWAASSSTIMSTPALAGFFMFVVLAVLVLRHPHRAWPRAQRHAERAGNAVRAVAGAAGLMHVSSDTGPGRPLSRAKHAPDGRPARVRHLCGAHGGDPSRRSR